MIHKYHMNGYYIVLDVHSGAVHVVDKIVYDLLDVFDSLEAFEGCYDDDSLTNANANNLYANGWHSKMPQYTKEELTEAYSELKKLVEDGLLFSEDSYMNDLPKINARNPVVKALCLIVTQDCNLRCTYCFAEEGEYHGTRGLMSLETGKSAMDFLVSHSGSRKNLEVDFFGGEPLMNMETIKGVVAYAKSLEAVYNKNFRFTITTNGVLLNDENIAYINEHMQNVVLSIDGRREVNDLVRRTKQDENATKATSVYDLVLPKFKQLVNQRNGKSYYVRGTFTKHNLDFAQDVLHLADCGFDQLSVEPVVGEASFDYTLKKDDMAAICKEYEDLAVTLLERERSGCGVNFFHFMVDLTGGPCVAKRLVGCGAGTEYLAVAANGDFYPCHQLTGFSEFYMGNLQEGVTASKLRETFEGAHVYAKEECRKCFAKFYCSGGCAANAYAENGDLLKPYELGCIMQRKRTECAIMMKVALATEKTKTQA